MKIRLFGSSLSIYTEGYNKLICDLCGNSWDPGQWVLKLFEIDLEEQTEKSVKICPECLKAGPIETTQRMKSYAIKLRSMAEDLDRLSPAIGAKSSSEWSSSERLLSKDDRFITKTINVSIKRFKK
jgi:hypothetical protein